MMVRVRRVVLIFLFPILIGVFLLASILVPQSAQAAETSSWLAHEGQTITVKNLYGIGRQQTNAEIVAESYPSGASIVILASATSFPDALSGSTLSGVLDAPIVLVDKANLSEVSAATIRSLRAEKLIVLGSTAAISDATLAKAKTCVSKPNATVRLGGTDRYKTNAAIYAYMTKTLGCQFSDEIILATGSNFADALSISSYAAWAEKPIILCSTSGIDSGLKKTLKNFKGSVLVCGSEAAVSKANANWFKNNGAVINRKGGAMREHTSALLAEYAVSKGMSPAGLVVATSANYPDALSGAQLGHVTMSPIILVNNITGFSTADASHSYFDKYDDRVMAIYYLGGTNVLNQAKRDGIKEFLDAWKITFAYSGKKEVKLCVTGQVPSAPSAGNYSDAAADYTFKGWDKTIVAARGDTTYTARYSKVAKTYTITWKGFDLINARTGVITTGASITQTYRYGETIKAPNFSVTFISPIRGPFRAPTWNVPQRQDGSYCFKGWDKAFSTCTGSMTISATWKKVTAVEWNGIPGGNTWPTAAEVQSVINAASTVPWNPNHWFCSYTGINGIENIGGYTASSLADSIGVTASDGNDHVWREVQVDTSARGGYRIRYFVLGSFTGRN